MRNHSCKARIWRLSICWSIFSRGSTGSLKADLCPKQIGNPQDSRVSTPSSTHPELRRESLDEVLLRSTLNPMSSSGLVPTFPLTPCFQEVLAWLTLKADCDPLGKQELLNGEPGKSLLPAAHLRKSGDLAIASSNSENDNLSSSSKTHSFRTWGSERD